MGNVKTPLRVHADNNFESPVLAPRSSLDECCDETSAVTAIDVSHTPW